MYSSCLSGLRNSNEGLKDVTQYEIVKLSYSSPFLFLLWVYVLSKPHICFKFKCLVERIVFLSLKNKFRTSSSMLAQLGFSDVGGDFSSSEHSTAFLFSFVWPRTLPSKIEMEIHSFCDLTSPFLHHDHDTLSYTGCSRRTCSKKPLLTQVDT